MVQKDSARMKAANALARKIVDGKVKVTGLERLLSAQKRGKMSKREATGRIVQILELQRQMIQNLPMPAEYYMRTRGSVPVPFEPIKIKGKKAKPSAPKLRRLR